LALGFQCYWRCWFDSARDTNNFYRRSDRAR